MINADIRRREYGFLGDKIHFNCASVGLPPMSVQNACRDFYTKEYLDLPLGISHGYEGQRARTREKLARLINSSAENIAFVHSTAEGISHLAVGLELKKGDNVVTVDLENPSGMLPWLNARDMKGFDLRILTTKGGVFTPDELFSLCDENTKVLFISAVQYGTGFYADLEKIGEFCREKGIIFAVDAIQAMGRLKIDVKKYHIGYLACGGFKGLTAAFGTGFVHAEQAVLDKMTMPYAGAVSSEDYPFAPEVFSPDHKFIRFTDARKLENGSHNTFGIRMMEASCDLLLELGTDDIERHVLSLENTVRSHVERLGLDGVHLDEAHRSGIVVLYFDKAKYGAVKAAFDKKKIICSLREGYARISLSWYNTKEEIDALCQALEAMKTL